MDAQPRESSAERPTRDQMEREQHEALQARRSKKAKALDQKGSLTVRRNTEALPNPGAGARVRQSVNAGTHRKPRAATDAR